MPLPPASGSRGCSFACGAERLELGEDMQLKPNLALAPFVDRALDADHAERQRALDPPDKPRVLELRSN